MSRSGSPIAIRSLGPEEAHILDRVRPGLFSQAIDPPRVWAFLAARVNELVVALDQGDVIGIAFGTMIMHPVQPSALVVQDILVHPDFRREKIATRLLERLRERSFDRGCARVSLVFAADNTEARALCDQIDGAEISNFVRSEWWL